MIGLRTVGPAMLSNQFGLCAYWSGHFNWGVDVTCRPGQFYFQRLGGLSYMWG
ncbi:hypothetical protein NMG60_11017955 [Bertholletia excelsa]